MGLRRYSGIPRPALPFSFCDFFLVSTSAAGKVNFAWPARVHRINRSTREQAPSPPPKPISTNSYSTSGPLHCARAALFSWLVRGSRTSLSFSFLLQTIRLLAQATSIPQARLRAVSPISAIALQRGAAVWAAGLVSRLGLGCYYERRTLFFSIFLDKTDSCGNDKK